MKTRNHRGILLFTALFIFAAPAAGRADNLFRVFPELQLNGYYGDNIPLRPRNEIGDFGTADIGGFFLDYTSAARYATLHWDTFAQLFLHESQYDRAGEGQYFNATDTENLSRTTKLRLDEIFYRDASGRVMIVTSNQAPQFNALAAQFLLANDQASANWFNATLDHDWGRNWSSELTAHQETFWQNSNGGNGGTAYLQTFGTFTEYHFSNQFSLGPGFRYYDFRFTNSGRPGENAQWPFMRLRWRPIENLSLVGRVGVVIIHNQGTSGEKVEPGGMGWLTYSFPRGQVQIHGGQEPVVLPTFGGGGQIRLVTGLVTYNFTQRLTGVAGGGYDEEFGSGYNGKIISWGGRLNERVNKWLGVYAAFTQLRRDVNGSNATGNYFTLGLNISVEAFRWSWQ